MSTNKKPKYEDDVKKKTEAETTTQSILDLPLLVLLTIFDHLPLVTLFHLDEVCRDWQALKVTALSRRKRLIIVEKEEDLFKLEEQPLLKMLRAKAKEELNYNDHHYYLSDHSLISKLPRHPLHRHTLYSSDGEIGQTRSATLVERVIKLLPSLHSLTIIANRVDPVELWKVKLLLAVYRHQLTSLALWFWNGDKRESQWSDVFRVDENGEREMGRLKQLQLYHSLVDSLNSLTALRRLRLHLQSAFTMTPLVSLSLEEILPLGEEVVRRLQLLHLTSFGLLAEEDAIYFEVSVNDLDCDSPLVKSIFCGKNEQKQLHQQQQELYTENAFSLDALLSFWPRVLAALRQVVLGSWRIGLSSELIADFNRFTAMCPDLRQLTLTIGTSSVEAVARALSTHCPQLAHLNLIVNFDSDWKIVFGVEEWGQEVEEGVLPAAAANDHLPEKQLPVLGSVTTLKLYITTTSHRDFEQKMDLDVIFPAVQYLTLVHSFHRCSECDGYDDADQGEQQKGQGQEEQKEEKELSRLDALQCSRKSRHPWAARLLHLQLLHCRTSFSPNRNALEFYQQEYFTREDLLQEEEEVVAENEAAKVAKR